MATPAPLQEAIEHFGEEPACNCLVAWEDRDPLPLKAVYSSVLLYPSNKVFY